MIESVIDINCIKCVSFVMKMRYDNPVYITGISKGGFMSAEKEFYAFEGSKKNPKLMAYLEKPAQELNLQNKYPICEENVLAYVQRGKA